MPSVTQSSPLSPGGPTTDQLPPQPRAMALKMTPQKAQVVGGHIPALDGIRGLAILMVMGHHLIYAQNSTLLPVRVVAAIAKAGWIGVDLFFVLSGFLI